MFRLFIVKILLYKSVADSRNLVLVLSSLYELFTLSSGTYFYIYESVETGRHQ